MDLADAAAAIRREGLAHLPGLLSRADLDDAERFALAHDFADAWRHAAGGRAIGAAIASAAEAALGPHHLTPHRDEKVPGHREGNHGLHLYAWHRDPIPQRTNLVQDAEVGAWLLAVLFTDLGPRSHTIEVIVGSEEDAAPEPGRPRRRIEGRRGDLWILPAQAFRRYTGRVPALEPLLPQVPRRVAGLDRRLQRLGTALANRANLRARAACALGPPSALDVALTVCVARRTT
jgi:hypothetical protein